MLNKTLLLILFSCFLTLTTQAQQGIYYQAVARSTDGTPLINKAINVKFLIHDTTATGKVVYSEKHNVTTDILGMFSVVVGQGTVLSGTFSSINWGASAKFVQQDLDTSGTGTQFFTVGTQQLMSVPYALHAYNGLPKGQPNQVLITDNTGSAQWSNLGNTSNFYGISTYSVYNITDSIAYTGGKYNFYNASGQAVIAQGVCWSTSKTPTVALSTKTIDSATGDFSSKLTGLSPNTTYHVRAYCTTSAGTTYGQEISFLTKSAASTTTFRIGQYYGGGYIFYIDNTGSHGLIMDTADINNPSIGMAFGYSDSYGQAYPYFKTTADLSVLSAVSTSGLFGTGAANTNSLVQTFGADCIAAYVCKINSTGGYNDWYLPSLEEVKLMGKRSYAPFKIVSDAGAGNMWTSYHHSTMSSGSFSPYDVLFGTINYWPQLNSARIRAIRSF